MNSGGLSLWSIVPAAIGLLLLVFFWFLFVFSHKLRTIRRHNARETTILELTPPPAPHSTLAATEEFFAVLRQLVSLRTWRDFINGGRAPLVLEVVSTPRQGIRYLVRLPEHDVPLFLHNLAALAPTVTAEVSDDYLTAEHDLSNATIVSLHQSGSRGYPLKHSYREGATDPIAYLTNAMSQLEDDELISLQIILTPTSEWQLQFDPRHPILTGDVPADIIAATQHKAHQPQFQASLRVAILGSPEHTAQRLKGIRSALTTYTYDGYQSLEAHTPLTHQSRRYAAYAFRYRLPALLTRNSCFLTSSELAALYHFPYGATTFTEDLRVGRSTALPVPLAIKQQADTEVLLGENTYRGRTTPIGLTARDRQRHVYVIGGTGNGKSTLLQSSIVQDMQAGKGVAVIDPHGDLAETILSHVPESRIEDVIYFNPSDIRHAIGLNLLELTPGLDDDALLQEKDMVTESIVSMFRKIFSTNDTSGHRIEYVLRNAVQTALTLEAATLFTVYDLLNDPEFRRDVVKGLTNPDLKLFWREFNRAGSYQQVSMAAGITAKIGRFLFSASARRIIEQPQSTVNFDRLMDEGKILICNVSKGQLGEDTSELFGIMVLTKLQLATMRRAQQPADSRRPFYVYVDEFQNFATPSFVQLLSEARKYGLYLTMAEQSTSQQSDRRMIDIVFANVGTIIAFRTSSPQDERLIQPLLAPYVASGTLSQLPAYHFYVRIAGEFAQPPFSGRTVLLPPPKDDMLAPLVVHTSRLQYGSRPPATSKSRATKRSKTRTSPLKPLLGLEQLAEGSN